MPLVDYCPIPEKTALFEVINNDGTSSFYNSWNDLGIIFQSLEISVANPQTLFSDVPFRDGSVDMTGFFGDIKYSDRTINMNFIIPIESNGWDVYSYVSYILNGKKVKVRFSSDYIPQGDPDSVITQYWYYNGRAAVDALEKENGMYSFKMVVRVNPYKLMDRTITFSDITDSADVTHTLTFTVNSYMKSYPVFKAIDNDIEIKRIADNQETNLVIPAILTNGVRSPCPIAIAENTVIIARSLNGNAKLQVDYQLGRL